MKTPRRRYLEKIKKLPNGCWEWIGATIDGQPIFTIQGKQWRVRRWVWPDETCPEYIGNSCNNSLCVRREHLIAVKPGPYITPEKPDKIVQFMLDNPKYGHIEACKKFGLTQRELIDHLLVWADTQDRNEPNPSFVTKRRTKSTTNDVSYLSGLDLQVLEIAQELDETITEHL